MLGTARCSMMLRYPMAESTSANSSGWIAMQSFSFNCCTCEVARQIANPLGMFSITVNRNWRSNGNLGTKNELARGRSQALFCFASTRSPEQPSPAREKSFWPFFFSRTPIYTSNFADVDAVQLSELWLRTLKVKREPEKIIKALRHSFAFVIVLAEDESAHPVARSRLKTVGVGRAVSDGSFIATICDVAVDPAYRHRGIGRRIVKTLVEKIKKIGGPSGFAVFPPPIARRFFWMIGFRSDRKYKLMAYRGPIRDPPSKADGITSLRSDKKLTDEE